MPLARIWVPVHCIYQCPLSRMVSSCGRACQLQEPEEGAGDLRLALVSAPALLADFVVNLFFFS